MSGRKAINSHIRFKTRLTGAGFLMLLVLAAMLTASINYANNMAYILTFLLLSLFLVGLLHTRNNLKGLDIANLMPQSVFAGEGMRMALELHNQSRGRRYGIWLSHLEPRGSGDFTGPFSLAPDSNTTAQLLIPTTRRGYFPIARINLVTIYPLGLFLVKGEITVEKHYLVYPHPEGTRAWPEPEAQSEESGEGYHIKGGDDFTGIRPYRPGESMHHVDWKAVARGRPMGIKEFTGGGSAQLCFDWFSLEGLGTENRLSQMCLWVLEADEQGTEFAMNLPSTKIARGNSSTHTLKCLEELALFGFKYDKTGTPNWGGPPTAAHLSHRKGTPSHGDDSPSYGNGSPKRGEVPNSERQVYGEKAPQDLKPRSEENG
ncbi:MAG: DUF58 domain-containing protein [bacterium]|nr:DUF58 domain-containing protein [bacterium]